MKDGKLKIALFHPWIKSRGGAERVVLEFLKNTIYDVEVYTWVYDKKNTFREFEDFNVKVIAPRIMENLSRLFILRGLFGLLGVFSKIDLEKYDLFFVSTSGVAEFITWRNYKPGKTFAYVHTILRDAYQGIVPWNLKYRYNNFFRRLIYLFSASTYRFLEKISWRHIDGAIFNSSLSLSRAEEHGLVWKKKVGIVNPPVDVGKFGDVKTKKGDYFLYVSRFNTPKRQDVLVRAWKKFQKEFKGADKYKLVLAGNAENKEFFERVQKECEGVKGIKIKTNLSDKELVNCYSGCLASVFVPFMEDFGIVPLESLAMGKPLLATDKGGYMELVKDYEGFFPIREMYSNEEMVNEIALSFGNFLKNGNLSPKRKIIDDLSSIEFTQKIEEIFKRWGC